MREYRPPENLPQTWYKKWTGRKAVFAAGSIEQGSAVDWQKTFIDEFKETHVMIFNPRRESWDPSLPQTIDNPAFRAQVVWEQIALERADIIAMYFDPVTKSPITLMEFGQYINSDKLIVACPPGYWRRGNLEVCCDYFKKPLYSSLDELIKATKDKLGLKY